MAGMLGTPVSEYLIQSVESLILAFSPFSKFIVYAGNTSYTKVIITFSPAFFFAYKIYIIFLSINPNIIGAVSKAMHKQQRRQCVLF